MKPNQKTVSRIADFLDYLKFIPPGQFNMNRPDNCIGGHCRKILRSRGDIDDDAWPLVEDCIALLFGIPKVDAVAMAYPYGGVSPVSNHVGSERGNLAGIPEAGSMLDHYASTGIVDWPRAMGETWR